MLVVIALATNACSDQSEGRSKGPVYLPVHIEIDQAVIERGNPMDVIEPVWWLASIYDGPGTYESSLAPFTSSQRLVWAMLWYQAEVNNGGHHQFYYNPTGIVWRDALDGFEAIGAPEAAAILQESADRLGGNPSLDYETRQGQLDTMAPDFGDLDSRFYQLEGIREGMNAFIRSRPEDFLFSGTVVRPVAVGGRQH